LISVFLSGLWGAIGIDPEVTLITTVQNAVYRVYPDPMLRSLFITHPTIPLLVFRVGAYRNGELFGLISDVPACLAGLGMLGIVGHGILPLLCAVGLGGALRQPAGSRRNLPDEDLIPINFRKTKF